MLPCFDELAHSRHTKILMPKSRKKSDKEVLSDFPIFPQRTKRLTSGEFDSRNYTLSSIGAQQIFLRTIQVLAPEVLQDLKESCLEVFTESALPEYHWRLFPHVCADLFDNNIRPEESFLSAIREGIWSWSERWNLDTDWCRERAFYTLVKWGKPTTAYTYTEEEGDKEITVIDERTDWSYGAEPPWAYNFEMEEFVFKWVWDPRRWQRSQADHVARGYFEKEWREYLDKVEETFIQATNATRSLTAPKQEHFNWLVLYQIKRLSAEEIFAQDNPSAYASRKKEGNVSEYTKYIRKAYNKLAKFIYLPLRNDGIRPGRKALKT
jgi:hypothetical protein